MSDLDPEDGRIETPLECTEEPGPQSLPFEAEDRSSEAQGDDEGTSGQDAEQQSSTRSVADASQCKAVWLQLRRAIRERVQPEQFETWFRRAALASLDDESICIAVQNGFSRDWLRNYYKEVIEDAVTAVLDQPLKLTFCVDSELTLEPIPESEDVAPTQTSSVDVRQQQNGTAQAPSSSKPLDPRGRASAADLSAAMGDDPSGLSLSANPNTSHKGTAPWNRPPQNASATTPPNPREFTSDGLVRGSDIGLNPKYTFENFVVGPCNRFSHAVSLGTAEAPGKAYNPLFLHGNVGLGKTHLLQSICAALLANWHDVRILFLSCETFVNHFISALENGDLQKFRNKYRNVDVLVVDDIHMLANKERTQEEFFHTFNSLYNAGKQIVLSSDSPPKDIPTLQDRLVSRFKWGLVTEIEPPCYETRMAILKRKGRERGEELPDEVAQIIAERVDTNIRELEGAVNKLYGFANVTSQRITVDFTREVLGDLFIRRRGQPTMDDIIQIVTAHFSVKLSDLQSKKRTNQVAFPRQIAMFLARKITRHSLEEIGGFFGGRDHSTVLHGVKKITKLMESDAMTRELLAEFLDQLQGATR